MDPAGTRNNNNVFIPSKRRRRRRFDVMKTLLLRHYCVTCPLGIFTEYQYAWVDSSATETEKVRVTGNTDGYLTVTISSSPSWNFRSLQWRHISVKSSQINVMTSLWRLAEVLTEVPLPTVTIRSSPSRTLRFSHGIWSRLLGSVTVC